jgi:hypothetical protein
VDLRVGLVGIGDPEAQEDLVLAVARDLEDQVDLEGLMEVWVQEGKVDLEDQAVLEVLVLEVLEVPEVPEVLEVEVSDKEDQEDQEAQEEDQGALEGRAGRVPPAVLEAREGEGEGEEEEEEGKVVRADKEE